MKSLRVALAAVLGFALGTALFHTPTVKAQGARVQSVIPGIGGQRITGTPIALSCVTSGGAEGVNCYVLTQ
jgi:hypothetical protein